MRRGGPPDLDRQPETALRGNTTAPLLQHAYHNHRRRGRPRRPAHTPSIIGSSSVYSENSNPNLAPYAATGAAIANFAASLVQLPGDTGIRVNSCGAGTEMDPAHPLDHGRGERGVVRAEPATGTCRAAGLRGV